MRKLKAKKKRDLFKDKFKDKLRTVDSVQDLEIEGQIGEVENPSCESRQA